MEQKKFDFSSQEMPGTASNAMVCDIATGICGPADGTAAGIQMIDFAFPLKKSEETAGDGK
ncbi:Hypothetical protein Tpal_1576 [Trichococcus palustris]|jgi:hypothetical protein|uniref:Uncharacterized protein n=1 Tax=Trichococcus palustris TaxID=140314 RepID=A0A143YNY2_9LACT|nr:hypothetical protein [Trichococcus palustris]CZQ93028.1 Hypothetical protein Tpal_1576 [Trichococcus palustris]SFK85142.1 hypothetical protein SAMN04488076_106148 [Trichococcus palustris]